MKLRITDCKLRKIRLSFASIALAAIFASTTGCTHIASLFGLSGGYSFTGASIPDAARTFSVAHIPNNATNVSPQLSGMFTDALRERFQRQTRLAMVPEGGDLAFEGEIVSDVEEPTAIGAASADGRQDAQAAMNRVTVTVRIRFTNVIQPELSFSDGKTFSAYADFDALTNTRQQVESVLLDEIVTALVDNIFNASVAQW